MDTHCPRRPGARLLQSLAALAIWLLAMTAQAIDTEYYIAVDHLEILTSGDYAGLPNPN